MIPQINVQYNREIWITEKKTTTTLEWVNIYIWFMHDWKLMRCFFLFMWRLCVFFTICMESIKYISFIQCLLMLFVILFTHRIINHSLNVMPWIQLIPDIEHHQAHNTMDISILNTHTSINKLCVSVYTTHHHINQRYSTPSNWITFKYMNIQIWLQNPIRFCSLFFCCCSIWFNVNVFSWFDQFEMSSLILFVNVNTNPMNFFFIFCFDECSATGHFCFYANFLHCIIRFTLWFILI